MRQNLAQVFILVTVVIEAMGIGIILPVMPELLKEVRGVGLADAARWGGFLAFVYALMQFIFAPILGGLADRFGRRPLLLISLAVIAVDYVIMALAQSI